MADPNICPLLDELVRDHAKYREQREIGRSAAAETKASMDAKWGPMLEHLATAQKFRADHLKPQRRGP